jgi:hypothetical protein|uniref:Uncharacterized protein n=1 Tax=Desulfobacca acetoxidans TaxID=60893 RepID=A0A7C5AL67_9BACT
MAKDKNQNARGLKLEIKVIPPAYFNKTLAEIARLLGDGPLLWPGGAGRAQSVKFVPYEIKKKRGRKPKVSGGQRPAQIVSAHGSPAS